MSNRLTLVLLNIISECQTCCIIGKDIAGMSIRNIIDMLEIYDIEGYVVKIDQEKAFKR
jgi:hypothetical protein